MAKASVSGKGDYKVEDISIAPATNGLILSYSYYEKNKSGKDSYSGMNYMGRRQEVFTDDEKEDAFKRMMEIFEYCENKQSIPALTKKG